MNFFFYFSTSLALRLLFASGHAKSTPENERNDVDDEEEKNTVGLAT